MAVGKIFTCLSAKRHGSPQGIPKIVKSLKRIARLSRQMNYRWIEKTLTWSWTAHLLKSVAKLQTAAVL